VADSFPFPGGSCTEGSGSASCSTSASRSGPTLSSGWCARRPRFPEQMSCRGSAFTPVRSMSEARPGSATVIIPTYTDRRWLLLQSAVESARRQVPPPDEVIVCVDHNPGLFDRCRREWSGTGGDGAAKVIVAESRYPGHLGASRTTAAEIASGACIVFLDDDAAAEDGWLRNILAPF